MAKPKKHPEEWHINFAEWKFDDGDKCGQNKPTIILNFGTSKATPRSSDDPSARDRALGAYKSILMRVGAPDAFGNKVEPPLHDLKVLVVGEGKIRRVAEMLRKAETPLFDAYLNEIPSNMGGTGPKWSRTKLAKDEGREEFALDGAPPAPKRVLTEAQVQAIRHRQHASGGLSGELERALKDKSPEARLKIGESFIRRGLAPEVVEEMMRPYRQQPELVPVPLVLPAAPVPATAEETPNILHDGHGSENEGHAAKVASARMMRGEQLPLEGVTELRKIIEPTRGRRPRARKPTGPDGSPELWTDLTIPENTPSRRR